MVSHARLDCHKDTNDEKIRELVTASELLHLSDKINQQRGTVDQHSGTGDGRLQQVNARMPLPPQVHQTTALMNENLGSKPVINIQEAAITKCMQLLPHLELW